MNIQESEHPEVKLEGALAPLKDLAFDANPVVVIVEPWEIFWKAFVSWICLININPRLWKQETISTSMDWLQW